MNEMGERGRAPLPSRGESSPNGSERVAHLRIFVFGLFFIFGGITSLNDVVIPKLRSLFTLSYGEVMLVQSAFFAAYFLVSIPAAKIVQRIGYMRAAVVGLISMAMGCLLFIPASNSGLFIARTLGVVNFP
jgi:MFS transporter, FHS family, L-fucose permease